MRSTHLLLMKRLLPLLLAVGIFLAGYFVGQRRSHSDAPAKEVSVGTQSVAQMASASKRTANVPSGTDQSGIPLDVATVKERISTAFAEPDRLQRLAAVLAVLEGVTEANQPGMEEAFMERYRAGLSMGEEVEFIHYREGQILGAKSLVAMPKEPNGSVPAQTRNKFRGWASVDPAAAKAWLDNLEEGTAKAAMEAKWIEGLSGTKPEVIASVFDTLNPSHQSSVVGGYLSALQNSGGFAAMQKWFDSKQQMDPSVRSTAFDAIMWRMGQNPSERPAAVEMFRTYLKDGYGNASNFAALTRNIADNEPGKCFDIIQGLTPQIPDENLTAEMIRKTIERSATRSLNLVGEWLQKNKQHPLFDRTAYEFALRTHKEDAESARQWAGTIQNESLRTKALEALKGGK